MTASMGEQYDNATELISMGIECLYACPLEFARKDPEVFDRIVDMLRGHLPA